MDNNFLAKQARGIEENMPKFRRASCEEDELTIAPMTNVQDCLYFCTYVYVSDNRAVMMEGIGSVLSGSFGAGHATTSYSSAIGYINYTGVSKKSSQLDFYCLMHRSVTFHFYLTLGMKPNDVTV